MIKKRKTSAYAKRVLSSTWIRCSFSFLHFTTRRRALCLISGVYLIKNILRQSRVHFINDRLLARMFSDMTVNDVDSIASPEREDSRADVNLQRIRMLWDRVKSFSTWFIAQTRTWLWSLKCTVIYRWHRSIRSMNTCSWDFRQSSSSHRCLQLHKSSSVMFYTSVCTVRSACFHPDGYIVWQDKFKVTSDTTRTCSRHWFLSLRSESR